MFGVKIIPYISNCFRAKLRPGLVYAIAARLCAPRLKFLDATRSKTDSWLSIATAPEGCAPRTPASGLAAGQLLISLGALSWLFKLSCLASIS